MNCPKRELVVFFMKAHIVVDKKSSLAHTDADTVWNATYYVAGALGKR